MAMINCPECGKQVSNSASNCIHCGYPLKQQGSVLVIERPNKLVGAAVKFEVYVNGALRDTLKGGGTVTVETNGAAGIEIIPRAMFGPGGKSLVINLGNNERRRLIVSSGVTGVSGKEVDF